MNQRPSQSALDVAGSGAERIAELFYWMSAVGLVIWLVVTGLTIYAIRCGRAHEHRSTRLFIIGGGAVIPTVVLTGLLCYGLAMLPDLQQPAPEGSLTLNISGVRWWWRVKYLDNTVEKSEQGRGSVESANEIRLPVNQSVEFQLESEDVIHSFWIPSIGGKVDMIPGRRNRLKLHPTRVGYFRGVCAEFCGDAHAQMNFDVIVMSQTDFDAWLNRQRQPAKEPNSQLASEGQEVFDASGCGACHAIRGTKADGLVGPDLTHFGSRPTIGAGILTNTRSNRMRWIAATTEVKPGVEMPAFTALSPSQLEALSAYLGTLQ